MNLESSFFFTRGILVILIIKPFVSIIKRIQNYFFIQLFVDLLVELGLIDLLKQDFWLVYFSFEVEFLYFIP